MVRATPKEGHDHNEDRRRGEREHPRGTDRADGQGPPQRQSIDAARAAGWTGLPAARAADAPGDLAALRRASEREAEIAKAREALQPLMEKAAIAKLRIDGIAEDVARDQGGLVRTTGLKSIDRAAQKVVQEYGGEVSRLKDIARNTIIVPPERIDATVAALAGVEGAVVKRTSAETDPLGYSGTIVNIPCGGLYGEIQVNAPDMIYAKDEAGQHVLGPHLSGAIAKATGLPPGLGHGFYARYRDLEPESPEAVQIARESRQYYDTIRQGAATVQWKRYFDTDRGS